MAAAPVLRPHPFTDPPRAGWLVVARKEFTDHLRSARFYVLLALLGLVGVGTTYVAADAIRSVGEAATGVPVDLPAAVPASARTRFPSFVALIGFIVPVLGIAFGFDAISGERAEGTLPRLVSQPIYRDDVINGKFAAGLAVIGLILSPSRCSSPASRSSGWASSPTRGGRRPARGLARDLRDLRRLLAGLRDALFRGVPARRDGAARRHRRSGSWRRCSRPCSRRSRRAILAPAPADATRRRGPRERAAARTRCRASSPPTLYSEATHGHPRPVGPDDELAHPRARRSIARCRRRCR